MSRPDYRQGDTLRAQYAQPFDFCQAFDKDMKSLFLLAFLLTGNRDVALQCFAETVEAATKSGSVFRASIGRWIKRCMIKTAIRTVFAGSNSANESRKQSTGMRGDPELQDVIATVTSFERSERFVFVMAILEGYSDRDCSLLLNCSTEQVIQLKNRALHRLPTYLPNLADRLSDSAVFLEASA
jgi:DNA-directed RNA polymerase specialized sigma24 family protein